MRTQIVCFKWKPRPGYRSQYTAAQPNTFASMWRRHCRAPIEIVCITDDPVGLDPSIRWEPMWTDHANIPNPNNPANPSCYPRLKVFDGPFARRVIGERFAVVDLDIALIDDCTPLIEIPEDFAIYGDTARATPYNGSFHIQTAGARQRVWDEFCPVESPKKSKALGYIGSDQGHIGAVLGPNERKFTERDGVYSFRNHIKNSGAGIPQDARMVIFHGRVDPWQAAAQEKHPWIREHYR